jgi:polyhydroxybutyrate depolymerase
MRILPPIFLLLALLSPIHAENASPARQWTVDGVTRDALVFAPASAATQPTPVVFAFHGHGGTAKNFAASSKYHKLWPEAIVVYPQGLNTSGVIVDPQGLEPGWQIGPGFENDRDLKFFDAMLEGLRKDYRVDDKRIYVTGHSNGGGFTYALWATRGPAITAVAPTAAAAALVMPQLTPKPAFIAGGLKDQLVKFTWQQPTIDAVLKLNQCAAGQPAGPNLTIYPSPSNNPLVTYIHPGGHSMPAEVGPLIVKFFRDGVGSLNAPAAKAE